MTLEGTAVFQELKAARERAKGTLADCQGDADRLETLMRDLLSRRGEALLKLAKHYLPEMSRSTIESTFEGIRSDLQAILARREAKRDELKGQLDQGNAEIRRLNADVDGVTTRLNEKVAFRERLEAQVAETLKERADFQDRSKLALEAEQKLHRDEGRVEEMTRESAEKLPQYDRSRLFRYLYDRGFSTAEYKSTGWVRSLDRWVADLIDFPIARQSYEFLKKTPELVALEVSKRRDLFTELMNQVEAIEKEEADKVGLTAVLAEGDALGDERDRLVAEVARLQKAGGVIEKNLADLEQAQDQFYAQAIERFRSFLGETKLALLEKRARQTPEPEDDAIVVELAKLTEQIEAIGPDLDRVAGRRKASDLAQTGLDRLIRKYRQANFDSDRSYFESFDPRGEIARIEGGELDADDLWRSIQSNQKFRPSWVQETATNGVEFAASPAGRVILGALVDIAGAAMREAAYRGVQRRSDASYPTFPTFPSPGSFEAPTRRSSGSSSSGSEGGFTSGDGF